MFNFNVPPLLQRERLEICKKCKFYNDKFGTCGTPIIGNTVEPEENNVTWYKEKIKLCGCFMSHKVKYRFTSCPAGKWHALNWSQGQIDKLDKFIGKISKTNKIEDADRQQLYDWYGQITGRREQVSTCPSCIRDLINEFRRQLGKVKETK
jgi:hypothetical protein